MSHISFSELKNWNQCPFYHKLTYIDKLKAFEGNEYTAFGTAIHEACENTATRTDDVEPSDFFLQAFEKEIKKLSNIELRKDLIEEMRTQGAQLAPLAIPALKDHFGDFTFVSIEEKLYETVSECSDIDIKFKGFVDLVIKTSDGKYHIIDWKTCSWGWDSKKKNDKMITYQLTLYKHFWSQKNMIDPEKIETHFALLKRTAKKDKVELFRVTSGPQKTQNAIKLLTKAIYNIHNSNYIKNRLACRTPWGYCEFYKSDDCS